MIGDEVEKRKGMDLTKTGQVGFLGGILNKIGGLLNQLSEVEK